MSAASLYALFPERCDQCGRCLRACPEGGLKVGAAHISIDRAVCTACGQCVDACDRDAIVPRVVPVAAVPVSSAIPVNKIDVGSRAEAKALRKAVKSAEKQPSGPGPSGRAVWTLADVAAVLAILLASMFAKNALLGLPAVDLMPDAARGVVRALVLAAYYAAQLAGLAFLARRHSTGLAEAFGLRTGSASSDSAPAAGAASAIGSAGWVLLLFVGTEIVAIGYGLAMQAMGWEQPARLSSDVSAVFGSGGVGLLLSVLLVAIAAPLVEELAFRGVILGVLGGLLGDWGAIGVSAALFAVFHFSLWMFVPTLVLGLALGWLARSRRSLVPAIALHVLYNAAAVAAAFLVAR